MALGILDGVLDRGLESAPEVEDHVGRRDRLDRVRCELEIVRLDPRRRQVRHADAIATDPLRGECQRVEAHHDGSPAIRIVLDLSGTRLHGNDGRRQCENENRSHT